MRDAHRPEFADALDRLAEGDETARDELVAACASRMLALANRMLTAFPGAGQCDDDEEAVVAAETRLRRVFDPALAAPAPSILERATAELKNHLFDVAMTRLDRESAADARPVPAGERPSRSRCLAFLAAVDGLSASERQVFHLVWFLGADAATVSRLTGRSRREVRRLWRQARDTVLRAVNPDAGPVPPADSCLSTTGAAPAA